jgi:hypothetical protein
MTNDKITKLLYLTQEIFDISENLRVLQEVHDHQEKELLNTKALIHTRESELKDYISQRDDLEGRRKENIYKFTFPNYPVTPNYPFYPGEWKQQNNCPVCGLDWSGPMGYCCNNKDCPTVKATCTTSL